MSDQLQELATKMFDPNAAGGQTLDSNRCTGGQLKKRQIFAERSLNNGEQGAVIFCVMLLNQGRRLSAPNHSLTGMDVRIALSLARTDFKFVRSTDIRLCPNFGLEM